MKEKNLNEPKWFKQFEWYNNIEYQCTKTNKTKRITRTGIDILSFLVTRCEDDTDYQQYTCTVKEITETLRVTQMTLWRWVSILETLELIEKDRGQHTSKWTVKFGNLRTLYDRLTEQSYPKQEPETADDQTKQNVWNENEVAETESTGCNNNFWKCFPDAINSLMGKKETFELEGITFRRECLDYGYEIIPSISGMVLSDESDYEKKVIMEDKNYYFKCL